MFVNSGLICNPKSYAVYLTTICINFAFSLSLFLLVVYHNGAYTFKNKKVQTVFQQCIIAQFSFHLAMIFQEIYFLMNNDKNIANLILPI